MDEKNHFALVVADNERAAQAAIDRRDFVEAFLLLHALTEALLKTFLEKEDERMRFDDLVREYEKYLKAEHQKEPAFVKELREFNRRRNRIIHNLWRKGFTLTNKWTEQAAGAALITYSLLIEWLETFDSEISKHGFRTE